MLHGTSCVVFSELSPPSLFLGPLVSGFPPTSCKRHEVSSLWSPRSLLVTHAHASSIYLNQPVARDALTFRPTLVARGTRDIHEPLRALFFPPITSHHFGQVTALDQSQCDMQTRLNSPGGPTLLLTLNVDINSSTTENAHTGTTKYLLLCLDLKYKQ